MYRYAVSLLLSGLCWEHALAVDYQTATWDVNLRLKRFELEDDTNALRGNSAIFGVGRGWVGDSWRFVGNVELVMGPYENIRRERVKTDFFGTGASIQAFYALGGPLRDPRGTYGLSAGLSYFDIVGRSVEKGDQDADGETITDLTMKITNFMVEAGVFRAWVLKARPVGNLPELLITRIEGYLVGITFAYPLKSSYSVSYDSRTQTPTGPTGKIESEKEAGDLRGYSITASVTAMLGF